MFCHMRTVLLSVAVTVVLASIGGLVYRLETIRAMLLDARYTVKTLSEGLLIPDALSYPVDLDVSIRSDGETVTKSPSSLVSAGVKPLLGGAAIRNDACARYLNVLRQQALPNPARPGLLVEFVDAATCPSCMTETRSESAAIAELDSKVSWITIAGGIREQEELFVGDAIGVGGPVVFDEDRTVAAACGIHYTPTALLFSDSGDLLLASRLPLGTQKQFAEAALRALAW